MNDKKSSEARRELLRSIVLSSGAVIAGKSLPETWSRPVVNSVMLPLHAQTSAQIFGGSNLTVASVETDDTSMVAQWLNRGLDSIVPPAGAQVTPTPTPPVPTPTPTPAAPTPTPTPPVPTPTPTPAAPTPTPTPTFTTTPTPTFTPTPTPTPTSSKNGCAMLIGGNVDLWYQQFIEGYLTEYGTARFPLGGSGTLNVIIYGNTCGNTTSTSTSVSVASRTKDYIDINMFGKTVRFPSTGSCPAIAGCTRP